MLNILLPIFIIISFIYAIFSGRINELNNSIFESIKNVIELSITMIGTMCLWNGIMEVAAKTSIVEHLNKIINPLIRKLFPDIKKEEKANKEITMNIIANIMGLRKCCYTIRTKSNGINAKEQ